MGDKTYQSLLAFFIVQYCLDHYETCPIKTGGLDEFKSRNSKRMEAAEDSIKLGGKMNQEVQREHPTQDEKNRFLILINHWIKHNHEHIGEYLKKAESLETQGLFEIAGSIREACVFVLQANVSLSGARNALTQHQPSLTIPKNRSNLVKRRDQENLQGKDPG